MQKSVTRLRKCHVAAAAGGNSGIASRMALLAVTTATDSRWCQFRLLHEGVLGGISAPSFPSPWILLYVTAGYSMDGWMDGRMANVADEKLVRRLTELRSDGRQRRRSLD